MQLFIAEYTTKIRVELAYFFRLAHQWKFNRDIDPGPDVLAYKVAGIVPGYLRDYVKHIQEQGDGERR